MNFRGKTGDSGSSNTSIRGGGYGYEEDDGEENEQTPATGQLFATPPSSSPSSSHHHHQHHQPPPFLPPPPAYHHHHQQQRGGWMMESSSHGGEPSSRLTNDEDAHGGEEEAGGGGEGMMMVVEREHMFDKVVTPSDVGKLNRLVIPKQHAERYFPLDSSTNDKGLLLNFEDRNGKPWRFRYSYWNSSQSYVMTKGWSRFVKDKKLDAGDIVSFQRGVGGSAKDRLFIDWRHRPDAPAHHHHNHHHHFSFHSSRNSAASNIMSIHPWNPLLLQSHPVPPRSRSNLMQQPLNSYAASSYPYGGAAGGHYQSFSTGNVVNVNQGGSGSVLYFRSGPQQLDLMQRSGVGIDRPPLPTPTPPPPAVVFESVPVVHGKTAAKRLRLFGVNMDCPISEEDDREYFDPTTAPITSATDPIPIPMGPHHYVNYHHEHFRPPLYPPLSSSSSSPSAFPYLQLRPYAEETQFNQTTIMSSSADALNKTTKSSSSNMSLDLDI